MLKPELFFSLNAQYQIAPESTADQLSDDLTVMLDVGVDTLNDYIHTHLESSDHSSAIWSALYLFRQAQAIQRLLNQDQAARGVQA